MTFWTQFWAWVLMFSFVLFLGLAIVVSVGGFFDIGALFKALRREPDQETQEQDRAA